MSDSPMYVYRGEALANYGFGDEHPFGMDRHEAFQTELAESGLGTAIQYVEPQRASVEDIALFHTSEYIELVSKRSQEGTGFLDDGALRPFGLVRTHSSSDLMDFCLAFSLDWGTVWL